MSGRSSFSRLLGYHCLLVIFATNLRSGIVLALRSEGFPSEEPDSTERGAATTQGPGSLKGSFSSSPPTDSVNEPKKDPPAKEPPAKEPFAQEEVVKKVQEETVKKVAEEENDNTHCAGCGPMWENCRTIPDFGDTGSLTPSTDAGLSVLGFGVYKHEWAAGKYVAIKLLTPAQYADPNTGMLRGPPNNLGKAKRELRANYILKSENVKNVLPYHGWCPFHAGTHKGLLLIMDVLPDQSVEKACPVTAAIFLKIFTFYKNLINLGLADYDHTPAFEGRGLCLPFEKTSSWKGHNVLCFEAENGTREPEMVFFDFGRMAPAVFSAEEDLDPWLLRHSQRVLNRGPHRRRCFSAGGPHSGSSDTTVSHIEEGSCPPRQHKVLIGMFKLWTFDFFHRLTEVGVILQQPPISSRLTEKTAKCADLAGMSDVFDNVKKEMLFELFPDYGSDVLQLLRVQNLDAIFGTWSFKLQTFQRICRDVVLLETAEKDELAKSSGRGGPARAVGGPQSPQLGAAGAATQGPGTTLEEGSSVSPAEANWRKRELERLKNQKRRQLTNNKMSGPTVNEPDPTKDPPAKEPFAQEEVVKKVQEEEENDNTDCLGCGPMWEHCRTIPDFGNTGSLTALSGAGLSVLGSGVYKHEWAPKKYVAIKLLTPAQYVDPNSTTGMLRHDLDRAKRELRANYILKSENVKNVLPYHGWCPVHGETQKGLLLIMDVLPDKSVEKACPVTAAIFLKIFTFYKNLINLGLADYDHTPAFERRGLCLPFENDDMLGRNRREMISHNVRCFQDRDENGRDQDDVVFFDFGLMRSAVFSPKEDRLLVKHGQMLQLLDRGPHGGRCFAAAGMLPRSDSSGTLTTASPIIEGGPCPQKTAHEELLAMFFLFFPRLTEVGAILQQPPFYSRLTEKTEICVDLAGMSDVFRKMKSEMLYELFPPDDGNLDVRQLLRVQNFDGEFGAWEFKLAKFQSICNDVVLLEKQRSAAASAAPAEGKKNSVVSEKLLTGLHY